MFYAYYFDSEDSESNLVIWSYYTESDRFRHFNAYCYMACQDSD